MTEALDSNAIEQRAQELVVRIAVLRQELAQRIVGQDQLIEDLLTALLAGGHVLLVGLPGSRTTRPKQETDSVVFANKLTTTLPRRVESISSRAAIIAEFRVRERDAL